MFSILLAAAVAVTLPQGDTRILDAGELGMGCPVSSVVFDGKAMPVFERGGKTYLLIVADVGKPIGSYPLRIICGRESKDINIRVQRTDFRVIREKSLYKPSTLSPEVRAKKEAERKPMLQALRSSEAGRIWHNPFSAPLSIARVSGEFGLRRIYPNHVSVHRGVDLVPKDSLAVRAISDARVLWAEDKDFYLEGKTVILDHGQGIVSIYLHLSEVRARTGDSVARGKVIGLAGSTGNSTGTHLHLAITVAGVHVDPLKFIDAFQGLK